jgi:hypothetical protein
MGELSQLLRRSDSLAPSTILDFLARQLSIAWDKEE